MGKLDVEFIKFLTVLISDVNVLAVVLCGRWGVDSLFDLSDQLSSGDILGLSRLLRDVLAVLCVLLCVKR